MSVKFNNRCLINRSDIDDIRDSNFPAYSQVYYSYFTMKETLSKIFKLNTQLDFEGKTDIALRIRAPISFVHASVSIFSKLTSFVHAIKIIPLIAKINRILPSALGIVIGSFETIAEMIWLKRTISFTTKLTTFPLYNIKLIQRNYCQLDDSEVAAIRQNVKSSYPRLSKKQSVEKITELCNESLKIKHSNLARRLEPWLAREAIEKIPNILKKSSLEQTTAAKSLMNDIQIQLDKRLIIHFIGLIALGCIFAGISLTLAGGPLVPIMVMYSLEILFGYMRYYVAAGWLESRDWQFQTEKCLPLFFRHLA